jgi:hypothetical protein
VSFGEELIDLGFQLVQSTRGSERYAVRPTRHLQMWVHTMPDGTATFTWEFELGQYLKEQGFAISVQDELSLMIFPRADAHGPAEIAWVTERITATENALSSVDFLAR